MEFNPNNNIVKLCLQGMAMEEKGNPTEVHIPEHVDPPIPVMLTTP